MSFSPAFIPFSLFFLFLFSSLFLPLSITAWQFVIFLPFHFFLFHRQVRLMGCQDLLDDVPGRSKGDEHGAFSSPRDLSSFVKGVTRSSSKSYNIKDETSSKWQKNTIKHICTKICPTCCMLHKCYLQSRISWSICWITRRGCASNFVDFPLAILRYFFPSFIIMFFIYSHFLFCSRFPFRWDYGCIETR